MNTTTQALETPKITYLKDYKVPDFQIDEAELSFDLKESACLVTSSLSIRRNPEAEDHQAPLVLNGEHLLLKHLAVNGQGMTRETYHCDDKKLILSSDHLPDTPFKLETVVEIYPHENTQLSGLYKSSGNFCTQCESEGFRRITYFLDRPDIMTRFKTHITADRNRYPVLLSNGNLIHQEVLVDGRHKATWEDPSLKPCYLFALVAGDYDCWEDSFTTQSGRAVALKVYVEKGSLPQAVFALEALKRAMLWDEQTYGREYDLDIYMIVAVSDFNFGAMENKGLNIFNSQCILAESKSATDHDYRYIEGVVGHEYFHNWTGNRVTCRDWFQISLKEGLTVFRENQFRAAMSSDLIQRIDDVKTIRNVQFAQDKGPMAHPVRPDAYVSINNFYTVTVYEKGAEVIRMLYTFLGDTLFRKGMDLYFERHDGQAVTVEDFVAAMQTVSGRDFTQFKRWYYQAGTPELRVTDHYDPKSRRYTLTVEQTCPPTPGQPTKETFYLPLVMGLLDSETGEALSLELESEASEPEHSEASKTEKVLTIREAKQTFTFVNVPHCPVPSLLRRFSAPVELKYDYAEGDLAFLLEHDVDAFNRWDAGQHLAQTMMLRLIAHQQQGKALVLPERFKTTFKALLDQAETADKNVMTELLTLPSKHRLIDCMAVADVEAIHHVYEFLKTSLAISFQDQLWHLYQANSTNKAYQYTVAEVGRRSLKNICLNYLAQLKEIRVYEAAQQQYLKADNMTDKMSALGALNGIDCDERRACLSDFYECWKGNEQVIDKWFSLQAVSTLPDVLEQVQALLQHKLFDIKKPNRVRALVGAFAQANPLHFHRSDGAGYELLADQVLAVDPLNAHMGAHLSGLLSRWRKFDHPRQRLMCDQLKRILKSPGLSQNTYEVVSKSLSG